MHCEQVIKIRASREAPAYMYTYALVISNNLASLILLLTYISIEWGKEVFIRRSVAMIPAEECAHTITQLLSELRVLEAKEQCKWTLENNSHMTSTKVT